MLKELKKTFQLFANQIVRIQDFIAKYFANLLPIFMGKWVRVVAGGGTFWIAGCGMTFLWVVETRWGRVEVYFGLVGVGGQF